MVENINLKVEREYKNNFNTIEKFRLLCIISFIIVFSRGGEMDDSERKRTV
jgi:hypothetical protein